MEGKFIKRTAIPKIDSLKPLQRTDVFENESLVESSGFKQPKEKLELKPDKMEDKFNKRTAIPQINQLLLKERTHITDITMRELSEGRNYYQLMPKRKDTYNNERTVKRAGIIIS